MSKPATISPEEMQYLLSMVTYATRRKFADDEGSMWLHLLSDLSYDDAHEAFTLYLRTSDEYLTPQLIRSLVKRQRESRWRALGDSQAPPNGLDGKGYLEWLDKRYEEVTRPPQAPLPQVSGTAARPALEASVVSPQRLVLEQG